MADKVRVKLNIKAVNQLMRSQPVTAEVARRAHRIRNAAGDEYEVVVSPHKWTARAFVQAKDAKTSREEARTGRLLRALDSGRGT